MKLYIKHMVCNRCIKAVENAITDTLDTRVSHI